MSVEDDNYMRLKAAEWKARAEIAERSISEHWKPHLETVRLEEMEAIRQRDIAMELVNSLTTDLAASQAREQELRVVGQTFIAVTDMAYLGGVRPTEARATLQAALARPSDTSALREFGLKVARAMYVCPGQEPLQKRDEAIVDAVLEGK